MTSPSDARDSDFSACASSPAEVLWMEVRRLRLFSRRVENAISGVAEAGDDKLTIV